MIRFPASLLLSTLPLLAGLGAPSDEPPRGWVRVEVPGRWEQSLQADRSRPFEGLDGIREALRFLRITTAYFLITIITTATYQ